MKLFDRSIYNIVMIHTARTWERLRIEQPNEEMPLDNICSTEAIEEIATIIINNKVLQEFLLDLDSQIWHDTLDGTSDVYIERIARDLITEEYL